MNNSDTEKMASQRTASNASGRPFTASLSFASVEVESKNVNFTWTPPGKDYKTLLGLGWLCRKDRKLCFCFEFLLGFRPGPKFSRWKDLVLHHARERESNLTYVVCMNVTLTLHRQHMIWLLHSIHFNG